ncbi:salivary protein is3, putative [Ixodes scapularis]|uniref:Salivary protein is3, putative n=1 Tax=Ixodes scapularis TaxID=6945 RepID=B7Q3Z8_IXOSC|nr:salivary protein is3, putative [Ixodes scapularis]|eukprot:XP_002411427.1 salivary protein is3, putative [Ixodes scapularis]
MRLELSPSPDCYQCTVSTGGPLCSQPDPRFVLSPSASYTSSTSISSSTVPQLASPEDGDAFDCFTDFHEEEYFGPVAPSPKEFGDKPGPFCDELSSLGLFFQQPILPEDSCAVVNSLSETAGEGCHNPCRFGEERSVKEECQECSPIEEESPIAALLEADEQLKMAPDVGSSCSDLSAMTSSSPTLSTFTILKLATRDDCSAFDNPVLTLQAIDEVDQFTGMRDYDFLEPEDNLAVIKQQEDRDIVVGTNFDFGGENVVDSTQQPLPGVTSILELQKPPPPSYDQHMARKLAFQKMYSSDSSQPSNYSSFESTGSADTASELAEVDSTTSEPVPRSYDCQWIDCRGLFQDQESLVRHIEACHIDQRVRDEYTCFWQGCPRRHRPFNARYKLLIHMRVHSGEKPNRCTIRSENDVELVSGPGDCLEVQPAYAARDRPKLEHADSGIGRSPGASSVNDCCYQAPSPHDQRDSQGSAMLAKDDLEPLMTLNMSDLHVLGHLGDSVSSREEDSADEGPVRDQASNYQPLPPFDAFYSCLGDLPHFGG